MYPVKNHLITSPFGVERIIFGKKHLHDGIDFVCKDQIVKDRLTVINSEVYAIADGIVCYDFDKYDDDHRFERQNSGGNMVIITHEIKGVKYHCRYLHLISNLIGMGNKITKGQHIGNYSDAGASKGAHLHFDVCLFDWSKKIDPLLILE